MLGSKDGFKTHLSKIVRKLYSGLYYRKGSNGLFHRCVLAMALIDRKGSLCHGKRQLPLSQLQEVILNGSL